MEFYRFQPINKLTLQNLNNQKNWVADPYEFNDPFEFSLYEEIMIDEYGDYRFLNIEEKANAMKFKEAINDYGVVCYSSNCYNNLLWSHYADNHKGMCLVFNVSQKNEKDLLKVNYQENFPEVNLIDGLDSNDEIIKIVTTKSKEWEYEKEYRQVFLFKNMLYEYPGELSEIIFGCRTPIEDIKMVASIAVNNNPKLIISKMHLDHSRYSLGKASIGDNKKIPNVWSKPNVRF